MTGLAAILASAVVICVAVLFGMAAESLVDLSDLVQVLAIIAALAGHVALWWGAFNIFCNLLKVPR